MRSAYKLVDTTAPNDPENTIGLFGNEYFQSHSIDLSARQAALMHHYLPYTGKTGYSGVTLTKLAIAAACLLYTSAKAAGGGIRTKAPLSRGGCQRS